MGAPKNNKYALGNKGSKGSGYGQKLNLVARYSNLTEPYFNELKEMLNSTDKNEVRFAITTLKGAFEKMLPQDMNIKGEHTFNPFTEEERKKIFEK